ncbi:hypothetical protein [Azospirillum melinis]
MQQVWRLVREIAANLWRSSIPPLRGARLAKGLPAALASLGHTNEPSE